MNWFKIDKASASQPATGSYPQWKPLLRDEGRKQCVYCAIHEAAFGGYRNYHVEHYRPKSQFPDLKDKIGNLFYCCGICNSFKGPDWPGDSAEDLSVPAYPDPSLVNYSDFLLIDDDFRISSEATAGRYVLERLYLNRPQLVMARKMFFMREELVRLSHEIREHVDKAPKDVAVVLTEVIELLARLGAVTPYEPKDVVRAD